MAKIQLVNIGSNNYFDKNLKVISLFKTNTLKKEFLDKLFENIIEFDVYSNQNTDNGIMIVLEGNFRYFTYAKLLDKYYFVVGVKTVFEKGIEKTQLYLEYDLINNSRLTLQSLKDNSLNNNFFLYRTNLEDIEPTYHNLLRCSNACENIVSDIAQPKIILYQLENDWNKGALLPPPENAGRPILYIKFKANKVPKLGNTSFLYLIEQLVKKFNGILSSNINKNYLMQIGSIINNEYTDFVVYIPNELTVIPLTLYIKYLGEIAEVADFMEYIALDYVDPSFINSKSLIPIIIKYSGAPPLTLGFILNNQIRNTTKYDFCGTLKFIPPVASWDNNYTYNHLTYAHNVPYFFSQRWTKKKIIVPYWKSYDLEQVFGPDNTFVNVYGRSLKNQIYEYFDNEKICNMQSVRLCLTPNLTDNEKLYNNVLNNGLASIGSAISTAFTTLGTTAGTIVGGAIGGVVGAVGGASVGSTLGSFFGGSVGTFVRGTLSNQWKQRENGLLSIASNENYKKYLNYHIGGAPLAYSPRYSIDIYENYLTEQQNAIIQKDREKYGNYINDYTIIDLKDKKGTYYIEGNWITFLVGGADILLQDKIIDIFNRGVFVHFNPSPIKTITIDFISYDNDFIFSPPEIDLVDDDEIYITSKNGDIIATPKNFTYLEDDNIKICSSKKDIMSNIDHMSCDAEEPEEPEVVEPQSKRKKGKRV